MLKMSVHYRVIMLVYARSLSVPLLLLVSVVRSFSYTPRAVFGVEFLLRSSCCFWCGVSLTLLMLFLVWSFSYTPHVVFGVEFL